MHTLLIFLAGSDQDQHVFERLGKRHFSVGGLKDLLHPLQRFQVDPIASGDLKPTEKDMVESVQIDKNCSNLKSAHENR